jgi:hypothetical protein
VAAAPIEIVRPTPGPLGPVTVIGDSVLVGAGFYSPTLPDRLQEQGWGPIRFRAGEGYSTGAFGVPAEFEATTYIRQWRAQGWDPRDVLVNLGANDSGFCGTSVACARDAILHLVDEIGPGHRIWWPKITRLYTHAGQMDAWNTALDQLDAERDDFWTWDWPTVMATEGYRSSDATHLDPEGYRRRSLRMAEEFTAALAVAERTGGDAPLPASTGAPSEYVPLPPMRVVDTRSGGARPGAGAVVEVALGGRVPAGTVAVAVNVTATQTAAAGFLSAWPCGAPLPDTSSVNHPSARDRAAMAVVPLPADGRLCVRTDAAAHVLVDLQGAFVPTGQGGRRLTPLASPSRLADTRTSGRTPLLRVPVPAGADAVALNLTAVGAADFGFLTAFPCGGEVPTVSNVNFGPLEAVAGSAYVPVGADGAVCVASSTAVDVIVDLTATFGAGGALSFVPAGPGRVLDTRTGAGGWSPILGANQRIDARVAPPGAVAVTGTITLVGPLRDSFLTAWSCDGAPTTSSVNAGRLGVLANAVTTGVAAGGRLCVQGPAVTHVLFDTTGWWTP